MARPQVADGGDGRGVKLTTHLHLVPRYRMRTAIPPLHQYAFIVWCSVKAQENFNFYLLPLQRKLKKIKGNFIVNCDNHTAVGHNLTLLFIPFDPKSHKFPDSVRIKRFRFG
jgi:hypothetical protein